MPHESYGGAVGAGRGPGTALNVSLWVVQLLLLITFGMAGVMKSTKPIADLAPMMSWVTALPPALVRFIGISELLGALGMVLPMITRIKPWLTAVAAAGLATVMLLAVVFHLSRGESAKVGLPLVLGLLAAFVAWGRGLAYRR